MRLTLTVSHFNFEGKLEQLPELILDADGQDYWLLLPTFEEIEEKTGKLIDLGESTFFEAHELEIIEDTLNKAQKQIEKHEPEEELLLERDDERLEYLISRIAEMINLSIAHKLQLISKVS
ncbi:MAG: hypothetical protein JXQ87_16800 [Bacteroidia bacterium]